MPIPGNLLAASTESMDPVTTGWTPKLNCTLLKGVGGRDGGDGCLVTKSVAAGEVQARIVGAVQVTAGTLYYCFADTAGVTSERIGIRWLTSSSTEISITWSVTTTGSSSSWHRVSVAGTAPAGATLAQVVLSSTETGANVSHYWENVYFGLPIRSVGNLLPFTTESTEVDASGWTPVVNATVSRQVPVMGWAVDNYLAGGHTLAMTAVASGNASVLAVDRPSVTPGTEYLAYAYLQPPVLTSQAWIELRYYDAAGNQISAARSTLAPPGTGMYRQRVSATAPATAASCSVAAGLDSASAGQVLRLETVVITVAPKLQAGSLLPYADSSFEQGVGGWTTVSGVATLARTTPWGNSYFDGSYALAVTSATATASTIRSGKTAGIIAGENFRAQVIAHSSAGAWTSVTVRTRWYDAADTDLGTSTGVAYTLPGSSWYALPADAVAPAGATQAAIELVVTASATSSVLHVDQAVLWQVLPKTEAVAQSDDGYIALTLRELLLDDYYLTVSRVAADGSSSLVRGSSGLIDHQLITSDLLVIEDHEAPIGQEIYYLVAVYDAAGAVASTRSSTTVSLTLADVGECWLKDPGNPQRNMKALVAKPPDWQRPIDQTSVVVRGRRNKVVLSGRRQGLEGDLAIWTRSDAEREALHLLLDSGNTLLWQAAPGMGVTDMYVSVAQITEARVSGLAQEQWRAWTLPLVEQDMPVTTAANGAAGRTWQDILTEFATWQDVLNTYATWEDVLLDRRKG
jgi:hypothetical protein